MKKIALVLIFALVNIGLISGQEIFKKGDKVANLGIGFGNTFYTGSGYSTVIPAISGSFEYGIVDNLINGNNGSIGVGGLIGYSSSRYKYQDYKHTYRDFVIGVRGSFHYQFIDKLDTYAGVGIGYDIVSSSANGELAGYSATSNSLFVGGYIGARYYFTENFAVMSELGYDVGIFKIGVSYKF